MAIIAGVLLASCRKPDIARDSSVPAAGAKDSSVVQSESPAGAETAESGDNQRTRALPKPEDRKHPAPVVPKRESPPTAVAVEGRPGFVTSPFNGMVIDVQGLPPGTLVVDPAFPSGEKKLFRTP